MRLFSRSPMIDAEAKRVTRALSHWFPMPKLIMPPAAGIDISDASIKWLALYRAGDHLEVDRYGELPLADGIVKNGIVQDVPALSESLKLVKKELKGIAHAHAALPEEAAYVFSMQVPGEAPRSEILSMIEFEFEGRVPIPPTAAVYDYTAIPGGIAGEIAVTVFPRDVSQAYADAFAGSGISLLSLEVEARSIARAVSTGAIDEPITLLVDFGRARTGFAVVKRGIPIFTSTVEVGGDMITRVLIEKLGMKPEDTSRFKNETGLSGADAKSDAMLTIQGTAQALSDEVARHYHYWDTRRNDRGERMTPVGRVVLVGGNANLNGLTDFLAAKIQAEVSCGDVWRNVASGDEYIPPIERRESLQYATAIGLSLRGI